MLEGWREGRSAAISNRRRPDDSRLAANRRGFDLLPSLAESPASE